MESNNMDIELTERNRFLRWGPRGPTFKSWVRWFETKGVPIRVVSQRGHGGTTHWTIYKEYEGR